MSYTADLVGILRWLRERARVFLTESDFDGMPEVPVRYGRQEDFDGITARYLPTPVRVIEFSPGFVASCWNAGGGFWDLPKLEKVLLHELVHAWVDWVRCWSYDSGGHNEWFVWKAHQVGLDLPATRYHWRDIIPLHEEVKRGWDPGAIRLDDWGELVLAAGGWARKSWESLVSDCRVIAGLEAEVAADDWPRVLEAVGRLHPSVSDYKIILEIERRAPSEEWREIRRVLELWSISYLGLVDALKCAPPETWPKTIGMWHETVLVMEHWNSALLSDIVDEFGRVRSLLYGLVGAIKRCDPLCRFIGRLKERFDGEFNWVSSFGWKNSSAHEWEDDYSEEELMVNLAESNYHHYFEKPDPDIYRFFHLVLAA